jgi:hypothetical protein
MDLPYLSVVAVSRNDDHGGDPLRRTRLFIDSLAVQAERYTLPTELVLVDWNPPEDRQSLAEVLTFPVNPYFSARVIVVPPMLHAGFRHGDRLPLFQMIGKNVGIRRARGEFILATNIDILLDDTLFARIARKDLNSEHMYRVDRYDILNSLPDKDHETQQAFCREFDNQIRRNHRVPPQSYAALQEKESCKSTRLLKAKDKFPWAEFASEEDFSAVIAKAGMPLEYLHTNACGDFTLMHRGAWAALRGYGEFEAYSMHIDSIGCFQAYLTGYTEVCLLPPLVCYHIEHTPGSGWTPEEGHALFKRICKTGIPFIDWNIINNTLIQSMSRESHFHCNDERWGLRDFQLEEIVFQVQGKTRIPLVLSHTDFRSLAAVKPQVDFGILFQTDYYSQAGGLEYERFKRIVKHPFWKFIRIAARIYGAPGRFFRWLRVPHNVRKTIKSNKTTILRGNE